MEIVGRSSEFINVIPEGQYIKFDINNALFECHRSTISRFPDSLLAHAVESCNRSATDHMSFDRDATFFGDILNYMRNPNSLNLNDWQQRDVALLRAEAEYYQMPTIVDMCDSKLEEFGGVGPDSPVFDLCSFDVFINPKELEQHLNGRKKPAYLINMQHFDKPAKEAEWLTCSNILHLLELVDGNLIEVYGFKGKFEDVPDTAEAILYDSLRSDIAFVANQGHGMELHMLLILFIQKIFNSGGVMNDVKSRWPHYSSLIFGPEKQTVQVEQDRPDSDDDD